MQGLPQSRLPVNRNDRYLLSIRLDKHDNKTNDVKNGLTTDLGVAIFGGIKVPNWRRIADACIFSRTATTTATTMKTLG